MKTHMNPLFFRRPHLLGSLGVSLAGFLLFGCSLSGQDGPQHVPPRTTVNWALLSDTHINPSPDAEERGVNMADNLEKVVKDVLAHPQSVDEVIVAGDIAHSRGRLEAYEVTRGILTPVLQTDMGVHLALGNHDDRENFFTALPDHRSPNPPVPGRHVECFQSGPLRIVMLDSIPGDLGEEQLQWLTQCLDAHPAAPTVVFLHHDVRQSGSTLRDCERLLALLLPRRQVKAVFHGHTHIYAAMEIDGLHIVELPATAYRFDANQPSGWIHATFNTDGAVLRLRALQDNGVVDGQPRTLRWR